MSEEANVARVLAVDDDATIREMLRTTLPELGGLRLETAEHGDDAIVRLDDDGLPTPDLVLLDVMMPGTDGPAVLSWIRGHDYLFDLPVVMLTARTTLDDEASGWEHGCDAYVRKPFDPHELVAVIRTTLSAGPELRIARRRRRLGELLTVSRHPAVPVPAGGTGESGPVPVAHMRKTP